MPASRSRSDGSAFESKIPDGKAGDGLWPVPRLVTALGCGPCICLVLPAYTGSSRCQSFGIDAIRAAPRREQLQTVHSVSGGLLRAALSVTRDRTSSRVAGRKGGHSRASDRQGHFATHASVAAGHGADNPAAAIVAISSQAIAGTIGCRSGASPRRQESEPACVLSASTLGTNCGPQTRRPASVRDCHGALCCRPRRRVGFSRAFVIQWKHRTGSVGAPHSAQCQSLSGAS